MTNNVVTSEPITEGQIGKIAEFADELFQIVQKRVEALSDMIVRSVKVNRNRTPKQAIDATGRNQYLTDSVVAEIPLGEGEDTEVYFFKLGKQATCAEVDATYELRGLKPDPIAQMAVNEADPAFADNHPNGTQWKNSKGQYCFAACGPWDGDERVVNVLQGGYDWGGSWWFAGVRKSALITK